MDSGASVTRCTACQQELPADAAFCGYCGFRLVPISRSSHRSLSQTLPPLVEEVPLLLTKPKKKRPQPSRGNAVATAAARMECKAEVVEEPAGRPPPRIGGDQVQPRKAKLKIVPDPAQDADKLAPAPFHAPGPRQQKAPVKPDPSYFPPRDPLRSPALSVGEKEHPVKQLGESDRRFKRYPLKIEVTYSSDHNFYTGFMVNMSSGGLFVATHEPSQLGELIELTFSVPGLESCTVVCRVQWIRDYDPDSSDMVPGMGLQFSQLDPEARAAIELFIKHRDTIFFDDE